MSPFLRKVRTASGATAVQLVAKEGRKNRVLKHIGSAHSEAELAVLMEAGRKDLHQGQMEFDLFPGSGLGAGKAQTVSKKSAVLWSVLREAYQSLGFDKAVNDEAFELLVLGRIVEPVSKSDTIRVLRELGLEAPHENTFYNCLRRAAGRDYRSRVAEACFAHASRAGDLSLVLYDVTTLYFEAENEDEYWGPNEGLRKPGFSKERHVDPQIVVGLLVDRAGFPLEVGCFEGNKAEALTILPIVQDFQARHGIEGLVVVLAALRVARRFLDLGQSSKLVASRSSSRWLTPGC